MTTDSDKCSISSILPMSCRSRAEAFARSLHTRLRSLGTEDGSPTNETSWLATNENPVAISQPRHSSESDLCFDFSLMDSPGSPEEEAPESDLVNFITYNKDNLHLVPKEDYCDNKADITAISLNSNCQSASSDSDSSEGQYYDPDSDIDQKIKPRLVSGVIEDCNGFPYYSAASDESALSLTVSEEEYALDLWECPVEFNLSRDAPQSENTKQFPTKIHDVVDELQPTANIITDVNFDSRNLLKCSDDKKYLGQMKSDNNKEVHRSSENLMLDLSKLQKNSDVPNTHESLCNTINSAVNGIKNISEETQTDSELINTEESYCSRLTIENNLTIDFNNSKKSEGALLNKVEVNIQSCSDANDQEEPIPRVRRCSSLKSGKTPPGTPGRKKIVRFADVLGLDLADVRTFLDEIPKVPNSAYSDLLNVDMSSSLPDNSLNSMSNKCTESGNILDKMLLPLFQQPGGQTNFLDRVKENQVCLENAVIDDPIALSIKGTVRVRNLDFHKSVHLRYTTDSWKSYSDLQAAYVQNSCDGFSDKFCFLLYANAVSIGQRLEFAIRFQCKGSQYWDNNNGANYIFQCLRSTSQTLHTAVTNSNQQWSAAFY